MDAGWPWPYHGMNRSLLLGRSAEESMQYSHIRVRAVCIRKIMFQGASV